MTELQAPGEFDALERQLAMLAQDVVFPPTPTFALPGPAIQPEMTGRILRFPRSTWWKAGLIAAIVLIATVLAFPDARHAAADWFGFPGIRIEVGDEADDPPQTVTSIGGELLLGQRTTLDEAQERVDFPAMTPRGDLTAVEPEVYLNSVRGLSVVSLIYPESGALPGIGTTGVGLLLMQIDATDDTSMMIVKRASGESSPITVDVNGNRGLWIQGGVLMTDAGDPFWTYQRRSGNVLVWEEEGVTYRMESNLTMTEAIAIADSLAPVGE